MRLSFPLPSNYTPTAIGQAFDALRRALLGVVSADEAAPYVHLLSPGGKVFKITVSDAGTVTATQVGVA